MSLPNQLFSFETNKHTYMSTETAVLQRWSQTELEKVGWLVPAPCLLSPFWRVYQSPWGGWWTVWGTLGNRLSLVARHRAVLRGGVGVVCWAQWQSEGLGCFLLYFQSLPYFEFLGGRAGDHFCGWNITPTWSQKENGEAEQKIN